MSGFRKYLEKQLGNEEFKMEHKAIRVEFDVVRALIAARIESLNQKGLAELSSVRQSNFSRI